MFSIRAILERIFKPPKPDLEEVFGTESLAYAEEFYSGKDDYFWADFRDGDGKTKRIVFCAYPFSIKSHWVLGSLEEDAEQMIAVRKSDHKVLLVSNSLVLGQEEVPIGDSFALFGKRLVLADPNSPPPKNDP